MSSISLTDVLVPGDEEGARRAWHRSATAWNASICSPKGHVLRNCTFFFHRGCCSCLSAAPGARWLMHRRRPLTQWRSWATGLQRKGARGVFTWIRCTFSWHRWCTQREQFREWLSADTLCKWCLFCFETSREWSKCTKVLAVPQWENYKATHTWRGDWVHIPGHLWS